jgi:hypothetical protein
LCSVVASWWLNPFDSLFIFMQAVNISSTSMSR